MNKQKYRHTKAWKTFRSEILKSQKFCELCGSKSKKLHIHHRNEEAYGKETKEDVAVLCTVCHRYIVERLSRRKHFIKTKYTDTLLSIIEDFT